MKKFLTLFMGGCLLMAFALINDSLALEEGARSGRIVFGTIDSVSEDNLSGLLHVHFAEQTFPVLPDSSAFNGILKLPLPFEAQIVLKTGGGGKTYVVDIQPRYH